MSSSEYILAADVGGTNTRLQLFRVDPNAEHIHGRRAPGELVFERKYQNTHHGSLLEVAQQFMRDSSVSTPPVTGCFAVAGPVSNNRVVFTNRQDWNADGDQLARALGAQRVLIVNDFVANGYGLLTLDEPTECVILQNAPKQIGAPIACIGAGTGLGECYLTCAPGQEYICYPSEGGHAEFAPRTDLEMELLDFLKHKFSQRHRVSVERVISGPGLASVYEFLTTKFPDKVDPAIQRDFDNAGDLKGAVVAQNAARNDLCRMTMEIFTAAYGSEAGVAGLKWLPFGGLYLTGGLTPKNIDWITGHDGIFMHALKDKGRVSGMLDKVPIYAVLVEDLGLRGASLQAFQLLKNVRKTSTADSGSGSKRCSYCGSHMLAMALVAGAAALGFVVGRSLRR